MSSIDSSPGDKMALKISQYMPATIAWLLLLVISGAFYYLVIPGFIEQFKIVGIVLSIVEALLFLSVVSNFLAATVMDPGVVPKASDMEEQQHSEFRTPLYKTTEIHGISVRMKWCVTCHFYRPPRCSHCSVCDHCIDSFDHHCPWLNNCIGRRNYRHFFIFLLTLTVHIICVFFICFFYTLRMKTELLTKENIGSMIIMVVSGVIFMPVIGLTSFHVFLVATGRTTNEQVTGKYRSGYNPFNKGFCRNVALVCFGPQFPRFADYVGHQETPDIENLHAMGAYFGTRSTAVPEDAPGPLSAIEPHQVHVYTPEDDHGPSGSKKLGHDGFVEYKPLKKQPIDLLKPITDLEERGSSFGDMSRDSSMVTIRRFPKGGDDGSVLGLETQGSKCNLLDENESALDVPMVNFRKGPGGSSSGGDAEGSMDHEDQREGIDRYSSPGNDRYQQMLKEAYSGANAKETYLAKVQALRNGPAKVEHLASPGTNATRPIAGAPKFAYVPASSLQQSSIVNKSQSMDALKYGSVTSASSSSHSGQPLVHSSIPPRLASVDSNYKRPLSFTQAVQLHDSLTQSRIAGAAKSSPASGAAAAGKRSAPGTAGNVNEIRV